MPQRTREFFAYFEETMYRPNSPSYEIQEALMRGWKYQINKFCEEPMTEERKNQLCSSYSAFAGKQFET